MKGCVETEEQAQEIARGMAEDLGPNWVITTRKRDFGFVRWDIQALLGPVKIQYLWMEHTGPFYMAWHTSNKVPGHWTGATPQEAYLAACTGLKRDLQDFRDAVQEFVKQGDF